MKIQKIANKALSEMVKSYSKSGKESFSIEYFKQFFPDESEDYISKGLFLSESDNLASVYAADGIAYMTFLTPQGIRNCQEDTSESSTASWINITLPPFCLLLMSQLYVLISHLSIINCDIFTFCCLNHFLY